MGKSASVFATVLFLGFASAAAAADGAAARDVGLNVEPERAAWPAVQGRVSFNAASPAGRHPFGEGGGQNVRQPAGVEGFSVMGDYYFAHPFAASGGFRATSGLLVGPRSQALSIAQPTLGAGGSLSVDRRALAQPTPLRGRGDAAGSDTAALPYLGLGYTARAARGALSVSADLGMVGRIFGGDNQARPFAASLRSLDEPGHDSRLLPVLQLGVLYSF